jgi:tetratricopeptide (TPR) repeat protein
VSGAPALFRRLLVGLVVAVILLGFVEVGLHSLPLDRWERDNPNVSYPLFIPGSGELADRYVTNPHFSRNMSVQSFARVKPIGVKRVFVLGGSAAIGWPGDPASSFSGYLQRALDQLYPGRYEIVNVAAMSYGSHRVRDFLADVVRMEPDLIVVWSGNNEYVERNTLSRFARGETMGRLQRLLRHSSLYRSLRLLLGVTAPQLFVRPEGADITDPRETPQVRRGMLGRSAVTDRQVAENYRANLEAIAALIRESGAEGMLCTVPVNLSGWAPNNQPPEFAGAEEGHLFERLREEAGETWRQRRFDEAVARYKELLALAPRYALGYFLLGDCYRALGRLDEARRAFDLAREFDPRPIRALPDFAGIVRQVAAANGLSVIDLERAFLDASGAELSGLDLFLDYVHPNEVGHKLAAATVLSAMQRHFDPGLGVARLSALIAQDDWLERNPYHLAEMFNVVGMTLSNNGDLDGAEQAFLRALREDPAFPEPACSVGHIHEHRGDLQRAKDYYQQAVVIDPGTICNTNLARVLYRLGDRRAAREAGERLLAEGVVEVEIYRLMGEIAAEENRFADALNFYLQAGQAGDASAELQQRLGDIYRVLGDEVKAREAYRRAKPISN